MHTESRPARRLPANNNSQNSQSTQTKEIAIRKRRINTLDEEFDKFWVLFHRFFSTLAQSMENNAVWVSISYIPNESTMKIHMQNKSQKIYTIFSLSISVVDFESIFRILLVIILLWKFGDIVFDSWKAIRNNWKFKWRPDQKILTTTFWAQRKLPIWSIHFLTMKDQQRNKSKTFQPSYRLPLSIDRFGGDITWSTTPSKRQTKRELRSAIIVLRMSSI